MAIRGKITERSLYPILINEIKNKGGHGVSEINYNSEPDIVFNLLNRKWLLSVKIGETVPILKSAIIQYQRHKEESKIDHGLILFMPESIRKTEADEESLKSAVYSNIAVCLVDTPKLKEEYKNITFPQIISRLISEVGPKLQKELERSYPLKLVITLLQQHLNDLIGVVSIDDKSLLKVITDKRLLSDIGHLKDTEPVIKFLATYIILSQIMFLRLLWKENKQLQSITLKPITHHSLRNIFSKILEVNYRHIFKTDVLDTLSEEYLKDTFDLIWGLQVDQIRHELPGRIFHELMPPGTRKMLAAFYTRPLSANLLANLAINESNSRVFDPACGSGTILVSAYKRKKDLYEKERFVGNPHRKFCEEDIFGADIMPFAVHLTGANLAAMEPGITISRNQLIEGDSLKLIQGSYDMVGEAREQSVLWPEHRHAEMVSGELYNVDLKEVETVLMNPPFTKVERGIKKYVDMEKFNHITGGEVGLWAHFIVLGDGFLLKGGIFGGVLPISLMRGRESLKIREHIFEKWTPLYILKPTYNYGFSEWAEYRDILFIAKKEKPTEDHKVKFCLVKQDLTKLDEEDISKITNLVKTNDRLRTEGIDIESFSIKELKKRMNNMMWFFGVANFDHREKVINFVNKRSGNLKKYPEKYLREGFRPVPKNVSSFLFMTRADEESRTTKAFLSFKKEDQKNIWAKTNLNVEYKVEKDTLEQSLRTGNGIKTMCINGKHDYIAKMQYKSLKKVLEASGYKNKDEYEEIEFWRNIPDRIYEVATNIVVVRRINPYSPNTYLTSFYSDDVFYPSNTLNVINEPDKKKAKAVCVILNSIIFLAQFLISKEETTGRYIDIRFYDLYEMDLYPEENVIEPLVDIYEKYKSQVFPPIIMQLDENFNRRHKEYWRLKRKDDGQMSLFTILDKPISPSIERLNFDLEVTNALGYPSTKEELISIYEALVKEMIITKGLKRD